MSLIEHPEFSKILLFHWRLNMSSASGPKAQSIRESCLAALFGGMEGEPMLVGYYSTAVGQDSV